jgi:hypothetical protein
MRTPALIAKVNPASFCESILENGASELEAIANFQKFAHLIEPHKDMREFLDGEVFDDAMLYLIEKHKTSAESSSVAIVLHLGSEAESIYAKFQTGEYQSAFCFGAIGKKSISLIDLASKAHAKKKFLNFTEKSCPEAIYSGKEYPSGASMTGLDAALKLYEAMSGADFFELCNVLGYNEWKMLPLAMHLNKDARILTKILDQISAIGDPESFREYFLSCAAEAIRIGILHGHFGLPTLVNYCRKLGGTPFLDRDNCPLYWFTRAADEANHYIVDYDEQENELLIISSNGQTIKKKTYNAFSAYGHLFLNPIPDAPTKELPTFINGRLVDPRFFS